MVMEIRTFHSDEYDETLAAGVTDVLAAAWAVDCPHEVLRPTRSKLLWLRHGWDGYGPDRVFTAHEDGRLVGHASVQLSHWEDNRDLAWFEITVLPTARRRGVGSALHEVCVRFAAEQGRTKLMGGTWVGSGAEAFAERHGYAKGLVEAERRLDLETLDRDRVDKLHDEAAARSAGYELLPIVGATPEDLLPQLVAVTAAINDAPLDDLALEDEVFTTERLRTFDRAQADREHTVYRLVARRTADGALAGHTVVLVDRNRDHLAEQGDTSVLQSHRGHRLGLRLKTAMLRWLQEREPQLRLVDTWNAASNTHMVGVNDALGFRVVAEATDWQRHR